MGKKLSIFAMDLEKSFLELKDIIKNMQQEGVVFNSFTDSEELKITTEINNQDQKMIRNKIIELENKKDVSEDTSDKTVVKKDGRKLRLRKRKSSKESKDKPQLEKPLNKKKQEEKSSSVNNAKLEKTVKKVKENRAEDKKERVEKEARVKKSRKEDREKQKQKEMEEKELQKALNEYKKEKRKAGSQQKFDKPSENNFNRYSKKDNYPKEFDKPTKSFDDAFEVKKDTQKNKVQKKYVDKFEKTKRKSSKNKIYNSSQLEEMGRNNFFKKKKKKKNKKEFQKTEITVPKAHKRIIKLSQDSISVANLAKEMNIKAAEIIKILFKEGMMLTINEHIDIDTATLVATEFDYEIQQVSFDIEEVLKVDLQESKENLKELPRAPIVTVMGHVDHGKTKLLDTIRHANIAGDEAGGITQHIGSYSVKTDRGQITFLDTPGHEAFTSMRARGANVTDIIILIVAADDGIMPQTIEAINHAKAANVPVLVAINKIDKDNIDIPRVKSELMSHDLLPEEYGGDTIVCEISAKKNIGLDNLLENLILLAEMLELKAVVDMPARATVIEAFIDKGRGIVANILVQEGTLKIGDIVVAGEYYGKVKAMFNDKGKRVKEAGPSSPVSVLGLNGVPYAGEVFNATKTEKSAKEIAAHFQKEKREKELKKRSILSSEDLFQQMADNQEMKELRVVVKADVQGSLEAVKTVLTRITNEKVKVTVIHSAVGPVLENDVTLAMASNAIVVGFNVKPAAGVKMHADNSGVELRLYSIIYKMEEEITRITLGLLDPIFREETVGQAEIREIFNISKIGKIAGCMVKNGKIVRDANMRIIRDNIIIADDKLKSLKRFKDDVKEVKNGYECGISLEKFSDIKPGDILEAYIMIEEKVTKL